MPDSKPWSRLESVGTRWLPQISGRSGEEAGLHIQRSSDSHITSRKRPNPARFRSLGLRHFAVGQCHSSACSGLSTSPLHGARANLSCSPLNGDQQKRHCSGFLQHREPHQNLPQTHVQQVCRWKPHRNSLHFQMPCSCKQQLCTFNQNVRTCKSCHFTQCSFDQQYSMSRTLACSKARYSLQASPSNLTGKELNSAEAIDKSILILRNPKPRLQKRGGKLRLLAGLALGWKATQMQAHRKLSVAQTYACSYNEVPRNPILTPGSD